MRIISHGNAAVESEFPLEELTEALETYPKYPVDDDEARRNYCIELAVQVKPDTNITELIKAAKRIEEFLMGKTPDIQAVK